MNDNMPITDQQFKERFMAFVKMTEAKQAQRNLETASKCAKYSPYARSCTEQITSAQAEAGIRPLFLLRLGKNLRRAFPDPEARARERNRRRPKGRA